MPNNEFGTLREQELLAPYTTWRIGGPARTYFQPTDSQALAQFLATLAPTEPLFWLGLGSNVLISDAGFAGTVIHTQKMKAKIELLEPGLLKIDAGVPCAKIAKFAAKHNLSGAAFFAGIPGTLGGALAMNAGAFGGETWRHVTAVGVIDRQGKVKIRAPAEYQVGYRTVLSPQAEEWFLFAHLQFAMGADIAPDHEIKQLLNKRNLTQPIGLPSCGSVFRNPPGKYAAELIEASKLKGRRIGGAEVSNKHANFIINVAKASAADVRALIAEIQEQVQRDHGVLLEPEVKFIGF